MKIIFAFILLIFACDFSLAGECIPLKVRNREGNYIIPGAQGDIVYRRVNGKELSLDAYVQRRGKRQPAVIVIHGGGFESGSRITFVGQFLEMLTQAGYNWFSIDYRLNGSENHKDALEDARAAIDFVRCHARRFRIDPDRIALLGEDSGALLASMLAAEKPAGIKATVLIGGVYNRHVNISPGMPETMIVHGTADSEAAPEQAVNFCDSLIKAGNRCDYFPIDGGTHRPENWLPTQWNYKEPVVDWLARQLDFESEDHKPYNTNLKKEIVYHPRFRLKLDAYIPKGRGPFPAVIIVHGGGWEAGNKVTYVTPLFEPLSRAKFAWFSIDYRLMPHYILEDQLEDLRQAIYFVQANARKFRVDPLRIAIIGESASGQMVTQLATTGANRAVAVVSFYGLYNFYDFNNGTTPGPLPARLFGITKMDEKAKTVLRRYSPLQNIRYGMPPILLIHGTNEKLWAQGMAMAKKLAENKVDYDFYEIENAPHGMENWEGRPEWMSYKSKLVQWLKNRLSIED